jgi:hypothetical protein
MTVNTNIMVTIVSGLLLIGFLFWQAPDAAPAQTPGVLLAIGVLVKLFNTDKKVETGIDISKVNTNKIAEVHEIVNSQRTAMEEKISALQESISTLKQDRAVKAQEVEHAHGSEQRIISAIQDAVATPPIEPPAQPGDHS